MSQNKKLIIFNNTYPRMSCMNCIRLSFWHFHFKTISSYTNKYITSFNLCIIILQNNAILQTHNELMSFTFI